METIFGELAIGDVFFDPYCEEDFKKTGQFTAVFHSTSGDYFDGMSSDFSEDEEVIIDNPENTKAPDGASV